ncbi:MAG: hypothetical protein R2774_06685 [Saprospiraceae bacterium]
MTQHYTYQDILKYYFKECDLFQRLELEFAMAEDSSLMAESIEIKESLHLLPRVTFSPRKAVLDAILEYSK